MRVWGGGVKLENVFVRRQPNNATRYFGPEILEDNKIPTLQKTQLLARKITQGKPFLAH